MILDKFKIYDKTSIITGAASGIGKIIARGLAEAGSNIVIADINITAAKRVENEFLEAGFHVRALEVDITNEEQVNSMVQKVLEEFGNIDVLINNAGIGARIEIEKMTYQDWQHVMDVNLDSVFIVSKAVGQAMIKQQKGSIINISSISGLVVNVPQCQAAYNTSKAGVIMLTKSLALEWAKHNIRVNTIAPGYIKTEMTASDFNENKESDMVRTWLEMTPMGRPGTPDELQGLALYLASDTSSYATGGVFVADGGYTLP
ncbi:SDR family NAD(P)-dependent oxidoreductase [Gracilibacillus phocaeensis]|uniref:SDR family NAD(P)-dependent oxidoreductase n=1 Tax=Gracilibacillus phocaeensis TaxID=2042304 RepID=UPI0010316B71|nr:SDR family oxidoreductase [Gracilibacillus phocaeensis]